MKRCLSLFLMCAFLSCTERAAFPSMELDNVNEDYSSIMIPERNLLLFANLEGSQGFDTKSNDSYSGMVSLESLLDRSATTQILFKSFVVKQIPFIDNKDDKRVMLSENRHKGIDSDSLTIIRTFLIETVDTLSGEVMKNVATMIPDVGYINMFGAESISFLDKSFFTGIILYSDLYGTFEDVYVYSDGPISVGNIVDDVSIQNRPKKYLSVFKGIMTKTDNPGGSDEREVHAEIEASYCIAYAPIKLEPSRDPEYGSVYDGHNSLYDELPVYGGGGGGPSKPKDPITYKVSLFASSGGCVSGSGVYAEKQFIFCYANADKTFYFDRWVGNLKGKSAHCSFQIKSDIESTAYFDSLLEPAKKPCWDKATGKTNPLVEMSLAPTSRWAKNYVGSTYGLTRIDNNGKRKSHSGIDLYAEPGTHLYAICDGVISRKHPYVTGQPMRIDDEYPLGYTGDKNAAGNRFTLEGEVNGNTINFSYWHLNVGTPIAINPRTGRPFAPGDKVYRGELIAYSGRTGNAGDVDFAHLHLTVKDAKGNLLNPEDYLNGIVSDTLSNGRRAVYSTAITGIKCDEEENEMSAIYYQ
ncbi:MAG: M23 family metallopeptidase [Bacteroidales bacterium]|nr:M23 family metallopeptidase [Bacteroidales bacterium]